MITLIGTTTSQTQAASAVSDLNNRGYQIDAELISSKDSDHHDYKPKITQLVKHDSYIMILRCDPSQVKHIKEHLGELHGVDNLQILSEKD